VAVARGKCGLGKVANIDWQEISEFVKIPHHELLEPGWRGVREEQDQQDNR
jgi:hypothetical protein